ncbi:MAG: EAL domain-containing protein [Endomicrobiia bacterium]
MKSFYKVYIMIFCSIIVIVVSSYVVFNFFNVLKSNIQEQIEITLHEIAVQQSKIMEIKINDSLDFLTHISEEISPILVSDRNKAMQYLIKSTKQLHFDNMAIVDTNGSGYNIDNIKLDVSDREYFQRSLQGERLISNPIINKISKDKTSIFAVPIYYKDKIIAILLTVYSTKKMNELLANHSFEGRSYTYIARLNGDIIINSDYTTNSKFIENLFDSLQTSDNNSKEMAEILQSKIRQNKYGSMKFENKVNKYIYYYPTTINDWYIFIITPINVADNILNLLLKQTINVSIINFGLFLSLFIMILYFQFKSKKELIQIAYVDKLTGGDSFTKFCIEATKTFKKYNANNSTINIAILSINIDNFKNINNLFGHNEGDKILRFIWETLNNIKMYDELHTRHIADQFYALFFFDSKQSLIDRLTYLSEALQSYDVLNEEKYKIKASIGICELTERNEDINDMINSANIALKSIKGKITPFYAFFDDTIKDNILKKNILENQMLKALQNKEFIVYFQPKFNAVTNKIIGAEALVKWVKKDGTVIPNSDFMPLFEKNFFITTLDKYIFSVICKKQKIWLNTGLNPLPISIGLSKLHFYNPNFVKEFKQILDENKLPAKYIQLEISEMSLYENTALATDYISKLRSIGFAITLKDFVIGYSAIITVKDIQIDSVKLNKKVVGDIRDEINKKITANILQLSHSLNVKTEVENIENEEEYNFFKSIKCDIMQGNYLSATVDDKEFEKVLLSMQSYKIYEPEMYEPNIGEPFAELKTDEPTKTDDPK